jgi:hypothetical protein
VVHTFTYTTGDIDPSPAFPEGLVTRRPVVTVRLTYGIRTFNCLGIVDTGADYIQFPKFCMENLGIPESVTRSTTAFGVGEPATCHHTSVLMTISGLFDEQVDVGFTEGLNNWGTGLLGWKGFLEHMNANFVPQADIFTLEDIRHINQQHSNEL